MNQEEQRELAIECGADYEHDIHVPELMLFTFSNAELAAYTEAVESPLQARIAQLEIILTEIDTNPDWAKHGIPAFKKPSTWLSDHDKEVKAKERERIAAEIGSFGDSHTVYAKLAEFIRGLK